MSEKDHNNPDETLEFDAADAEGADTGDEGAQTDPQAQPDAQDPLSKLQAERDELESKLLRVSADYQNFVRRAQQNTQAAAEQKLVDIARGLVTVLDHFDRALDVDTQGEPAGLVQGVTMVRDELLATLKRFGIERVEVKPGDEFDPNRHEALMRQPSDDVQSNHITMQMQPGYVLGEKVIRPAQVGVAE